MDWIKQNYRTMLPVLGEIILSIWTAISFVLDAAGLVAPVNIPWEYYQLGGFIVFVGLVSAHIYSLSAQLSPRLDLIFGDYPSCVHKFARDEKTYTLFRVGLINSGGKSIENVQVSIEHLEPQNITFSPIRLRFMHQRGDQELGMLHPSKEPHRFVDVIEDDYLENYTGVTTTSERVFRLCYAIVGVPSLIKPGDYRLTLLAEGKDVPPCRKIFLVNWDGKEMTFKEERSKN